MQIALAGPADCHPNSSVDLDSSIFESWCPRSRNSTSPNGLSDDGFAQDSIEPWGFYQFYGHQNYADLHASTFDDADFVHHPQSIRSMNTGHPYPAARSIANILKDASSHIPRRSDCGEIMGFSDTAGMEGTIEYGHPYPASVLEQPAVDGKKAFRFDCTNNFPQIGPENWASYGEGERSFSTPTATSELDAADLETWPQRTAMKGIGDQFDGNIPPYLELPQECADQWWPDKPDTYWSTQSGFSYNEMIPTIGSTLQGCFDDSERLDSTVADSTSGARFDAQIDEKREVKCRCEADGCFQSFGSRKDLLRHMPQHGTVFPDKLRLSCPEKPCTKKFRSMHDLRRHKASIHDIVKEGYRCDFPGCQSKSKIWKRRDNLRHHVEKQHRTADADSHIKIETIS